MQGSRREFDRVIDIQDEGKGGGEGGWELQLLCALDENEVDNSTDKLDCQPHSACNLLCQAINQPQHTPCSAGSKGC